MFRLFTAAVVLMIGVFAAGCTAVTGVAAPSGGSSVTVPAGHSPIGTWYEQTPSGGTLVVDKKTMEYTFESSGQRTLRPLMKNS